MGSKKTITQLDYVKRMIESLENNISIDKVNGLSSDIGTLFLRNSLPYGISSEGMDKNEYLFFNREYKPLYLFGYMPWADYSDFKNISFSSKEKIDDHLFFYDDSNQPWKNLKNLKLYISKLKKFLEKVEK